MVDANTVGAYRFYHCRANCLAIQRGPTGEYWAHKLSDTREAIDQVRGGKPESSAQDQEANEFGRTTGKATEHCSLSCQRFSPWIHKN